MKSSKWSLMSQVLLQIYNEWAAMAAQAQVQQSEGGREPTKRRLMPFLPLSPRHDTIDTPIINNFQWVQKKRQVGHF